MGSNISNFSSSSPAIAASYPTLKQILNDGLAVPISGSFASNRRNGGGGPMSIWKLLSYVLIISAPRSQK